VEKLFATVVKVEDKIGTSEAKENLYWIFKFGCVCLDKIKLE
jgi:hypothetical protein